MNNKCLTIFDSGLKQTPFATDYKFYINESYIEDVNFNIVKEIILSKEKEIINNTPIPETDGNTGLGYDSLTSRFEHYNLLTWNETEIQKIYKNIGYHLNFFFNKILLAVPNKLRIQCWANVMRKGDQIKPHVHDVSNNSYMGGHICVYANNTQTHYINPFKYLAGVDQEIYSSDNKEGKITLFSDNIPHYTDEVSDDLRITIAFDILHEKHINFNNKNCIDLGC
jgi:hypothetical protein